MTWQQFLTEKVLGECWHDVEASDVSYCKKCGTSRAKIAMDWDRITDNRTFDNRSDLMDLYQQVYKDGKWDDFSGGARWKHTMFSVEDFVEMSAWLFCLDQQDYEPRCKMVAEFYGWEGEK